MAPPIPSKSVTPPFTKAEFLDFSKALTAACKIDVFRAGHGEMTHDGFVACLKAWDPVLAQKVAAWFAAGEEVVRHVASRTTEAHSPDSGGF